MKKICLRSFLLIIIFFRIIIVVISGYLINTEIFMNQDKKWIRFLKSQENAQIDTTYEKKSNKEINYQITNGKLYYFDKSILDTEYHFFVYDYQYRTNIELPFVPSYNFCVIDNYIYYEVFENQKKCIKYRILSMPEHDYCLKEGVGDWIFDNEDIIYSTKEDNCVNFFHLSIYYRDVEGEIEAMELSSDENYGWDMRYCFNGLIVFESCYSSNLKCYDKKSKVWKEISYIPSATEPYYFGVKKQQYVGNYVVFCGTMMDSTRTAIAGTYELKNEPQNGVWVLDITSGKTTHIQTGYIYNLYVLNGEIYGMMEYGFGGMLDKMEVIDLP